MLLRMMRQKITVHFAFRAKSYLLIVKSRFYHFYLSAEADSFWAREEVHKHSRKIAASTDIP